MNNKNYNFLLFISIFISLVLFFILFLDIKDNINTLIKKIPNHIISNIRYIYDVITPLCVSLIFFIITISFIKNKYSIKVEQLSIGGINILFDKRNIIFKNSVMNYFDSKRTLFIIDVKHDNFHEVFNSYYDTYNFLRIEMRILDSKKDKELYDLTNEILMKLNQFLTKNQNNYFRWYKYISETNQELIKLQEFDEKTSNFEQRYFYNMPINIIQSKYYLYDELIIEFKKINDFFTESVAKYFNVNIDKWSL